jgi:hypothetical protein
MKFNLVEIKNPIEQQELAVRRNNPQEQQNNSR